MVIDEEQNQSSLIIHVKTGTLHIPSITIVPMSSKKTHKKNHRLTDTTTGVIVT
jgi:hypothetical protein